MRTTSLGLKMTVAGDSRDRALELARRMEESRRFAQTQVTAGTLLEQSNTGDTEQFDIVAIYIPEPHRLAALRRRPRQMRNRRQKRVRSRVEAEATTPKGGKH